VAVSWGCATHHWVLADSPDLARAFFEAVCSFNPDLDDQLLVFEGGCWSRSESLRTAIRSTRLDDLVLGGALAADLAGDLTRFFAARALYEAHGVPWKRGLLLTGPPGNGKTHAIKGLINLAGKPCLYVRAVASEHKVDESNLREIFERARREAPCVLVLEDLDALITPESRSAFLNEMDGFAANAGVLTLATTNHPERLDPAIADRPSRFDRKYHFGLPDATGRLAFLRRWSDALPADRRPGLEALAQAASGSEGFSFAYLKELTLASMMACFAEVAPQSIDATLVAQTEALRGQLRTPAAPGAGA